MRVCCTGSEATHLVTKLPEDLLGAVLSRLPLDERLSDQRVSRRWKSALRNPAWWSTLDLRGLSLYSVPRDTWVPDEKIDEEERKKVLRFMDLALPESAPAPSSSRLRFLGINVTQTAHLRSSLADIGRHPSSSKVQQLCLDLNKRVVYGDSVDLIPAFTSTAFVREFWEDHEQGSFPSLQNLILNRLAIDVGETFPAQGGEPGPFLAACDRVVALLRDHPVSASFISFEGVVGVANPPYAVDALLGPGGAAPPLRRLLVGLCDVLDVVREHVLPRPRVPSPPGSLAPLHPSKIELDIDSAYLIWDDPSIWNAVTGLSQGIPSLSIAVQGRHRDAAGHASNSIRFSAPGAVVPPRLIWMDKAPMRRRRPRRTYESAPGAYKHYLHNMAQVIEGAPSLRSIGVMNKVSKSDYDVDARWTASAAEALASLLLSLRSAGPALKEVTLRGFFGRRLAFPAPEGGSWVEPDVDSFAQAYMALVKANQTLEEIELGHLAEWCKPSERGRPSLPADAAATFSDSSVTHLCLEDITLHPSDSRFFASLGAHSRRLTRLRVSGCDFNDDHVKALAGALSEGRGAPLKELVIEVWRRSKMTDVGVLCFADILPTCGLEELLIEIAQRGRRRGV